MGSKGYRRNLEHEVPLRDTGRYLRKRDQEGLSEKGGI